MSRCEKRTINASLILALMVGLIGQAMAAEPPRPGFIGDSKATLSMRNFYINQDNRNESHSPRAEEWGQSLVLKYQSGFTEGPLGFGLDALGMWALRLDAGGRRGKQGITRAPGSVFPTDDGEPVHEFGSFAPTGKIRHAKTVAEYGLLIPRLPVILPNDSRLLIQTFRGGQITSKDSENLTLVGGRLDHTRTRASSDWKGLGIGGASEDTNEFYYAGADYRVKKNQLLQYYFGRMKNFYNQHFLGLVHDWELPAGSLNTDLRFFHSTPDGKNSSASGRAQGYTSSGYYGSSAAPGKVDNEAWSALFTYSLAGHAVGVGYQALYGDSDFPFMNTGDGSTSYLITNVQIGKFQHAGEKSWFAKYAYDFSHLGVAGLKVSLLYVSGDHIKTAEGHGNQYERNLQVDYVIQEGILKGLGFTWKNAIIRNDTRVGEKDQDENRLIVTYSFPLL